MFGYIRPAADELKVKEYNTYRAIYCGLCRSLGRCSGCLARFTLSYDFVFLALVRAALTGEKMSFDKGRCPAHPFKKRPRAALISTPATGESALRISPLAPLPRIRQGRLRREEFPTRLSRTGCASLTDLRGRARRPPTHPPRFSDGCSRISRGTV